MNTLAITLTPDDELARRLDTTAGQPVIIAHNGVRDRIERKTPSCFSYPEKMRAAIRASVGA